MSEYWIEVDKNGVETFFSDTGPRGGETIRRVPLNSEKVRDLPQLGLITMMEEGGIERQEKIGQGQVAASDQIPTSCNITDEQLEGLGFTVLPAKGKKALFRDCKFPEGWTKKRTDHHMYTDVLDEKGRKRASIMYKAAFYDEDAALTFNRRYGCRRDYGVDNHEECLVWQVLEDQKVLFTCEERVGPRPKEGSVDDHRAYWDNVDVVEKGLRAQCGVFLTEMGVDPKADCLANWEDN